jgi:rubredoxin
LSKWQCTVCGHVYDPGNSSTIGDAEPGTPFELLPDDWTCPDCGSPKSAYKKLN